MIVFLLQEENGGISRVHYLVNDTHRFVYPNSWTQATKELSHGKSLHFITPELC